MAVNGVIQGQTAKLQQTVIGDTRFSRSTKKNEAGAWWRLW